MQQGVLKNMGWGARGRMLLLAAAAAGLAACGGGDDGGATTPAPAATSLSGTAAVGAPIAGGTVQVRCSGANVLESVTSASGTWRVDTTGQSLPCAVRVTGGNLAAGQALHSVALSFDTLNITPLTDLIVANATAGDWLIASICAAGVTALAAFGWLMPRKATFRKS